MDNEKLYKEAREEIQKILSSGQDSINIKLSKLKLWLQPFFPELQEFLDESIRRRLCVLVYDMKDDLLHQYLLIKEKTLAWLEKQCKQKSIWHNEDEEPQRGSLILLIMQSGTPIVAKIIEPNHTFNHGERWAYIDDLLEKQGEQKPTDEIEPKFKEGDWVVYMGTTAKILDLQKHCYVGKDVNDKDFVVSYCNEYEMRKWTIQDAKDGDVLVSECNQPFIYNGHFDTSNVGAYCGLNCTGEDFLISNELCDWTNNINIKPTNKKQRDQLEEAMAYAGYRWKAETKELIKVPKPKEATGVLKQLLDEEKSWSDEDELCLRRLMLYLSCRDNLIAEVKSKYTNWLESIKQKIVG